MTKLIAFSIFICSNIAAADPAKDFLKGVEFEKLHREAVEHEAQTIVDENPLLTPVKGNIADQMMKSFPPERLEARLVQALNAKFSAAELAEMTKFFSTATGRKTARELPLLLDRIYTEEEASAKRELPVFLQKLDAQERKKKKGT